MITSKHNYHRLKPELLVTAIGALEERIFNDFNDRGLTRICRELYVIAEKTQDRVEKLEHPNWPLRLIPVAVAALVIWLTVMMSNSINAVVGKLDEVLKQDLLSVAEALKQLMSHAALPVALAVPIPFVIGAFVFIWNIEARWKRSRALRYLHELRSIIHVIDMHQLPKDPHRLANTSDPDFVSGEKLLRYLDYCSELLSLSAKVAAIYAERSQDPLVIATVSDLGQITSNLSSKIWQKLNIVERNLARAST